MVLFKNYSEKLKSSLLGKFTTKDNYALNSESLYTFTSYYLANFQSILFKVLISICIIFVVSCTPRTLADKKEVKIYIREMNTKYGFRESNLSRLFKRISIKRKKTVALKTKISHPFEEEYWDTYKKAFLTPKRINDGVAFWQSNKELLERAENLYGVPQSIIVSIIGVETFYGNFKGQHFAFDALAVHAFNSKRQPYFRRELTEFLILNRETGTDILSWKSSYAGALGIPQFMPSNYRSLAVSAKGKYPDLNSFPDAILSIANYLQHHGWQKNQPIALEIKEDSNLNNKKIEIDKKLMLNQESHTHNNYIFSEEKTLAQISKEFNLQINNIKENLAKGRVLLLKNHDLKYENWLTYQNFSVIMRYNTSPLYAMAVYQLSKEIEKNI